MSIMLEPPPEMETQLACEEAQKRMPLPNYIAAVIRERNMKMPEGVETYLLSEAALAKDWSKPEEDETWKDL